jgi:ribosomal protein S26
VHGFCGRGIGEGGYGKEIECTDCQKITPGDKTIISSPMEVDGDDEQKNSR